MNIVLLQAKLSEEEIKQFIEEFPQYLFLAPTEVLIKNLGPEEWGRVEVLFGNRLTKDELEKAEQLRWIHSPVPNINPLCLNEIEKRGNIIVTGTKEENRVQIAEYVIGGVLAFAKNLFHWQEANQNQMTLWDSKWRESMWTLKDRTFAMIGLGSVGTEIARLAKEMQMTVWGVSDTRSFHPHCKKVFAFEELSSLLPDTDVVCVALPRNQKEILLTEKEFTLMKDDSILVIIGPKGIIDEEALAKTASTPNKFRGILLDAFYQIPVSPNSTLWQIPNIIITPEVAPRPKTTEQETFRLFRYNLRQYLHGNFSDMRNVLGTKRKFTT